MLVLEDLETLFPLHLLEVNGETVGLVADAALTALPFAATTYKDHVVDSREESAAYLSKNRSEVVSEVTWRWCARVTFSVSALSKRHAVLLRNLSTNATVSHLLGGSSNSGNSDELQEELKGVIASIEANADLWKTAAASTDSSCHSLQVYLMSEPVVASTMSSSLNDLPLAPGPDAAGNVTTRVVLGNSVAEVVAALRNLFTALLLGDARQYAEMEVCWPGELLFPVNVHTRDDARRRAEHAALLLPSRALLHHSNAVQVWSTWQDLQRHHQQQRRLGGGARAFRTGESWERHLVTNPHAELPSTAAPALHGAETVLVSGSYDYYHYRVDGFRDDGWGCAYRSLQTVLSWFQHAGFMTAPIPSIHRIQEILYATDPDKANKRQFVGSCEWIGSFEVMLVLQHYMPGLDCTIKRLESGKDLDSDASVQLLLSEHFRHPRAAPVMIGGSSYAHTILGIHVNVNTMEARYLILDPHYSANPTQLRTAIKKGYVGWKEASTFFEAGSWYNLCIPRTDLYDPDRKSVV